MGDSVGRSDGDDVGCMEGEDVFPTTVGEFVGFLVGMPVGEVVRSAHDWM